MSPQAGAPGTAGEGHRVEPKRGTRVTAADVTRPDSEQGAVITDDYVLITDGTAHVAGVQVYANGTHVITVKGVRR